jgi:hypothetical protein
LFEQRFGIILVDFLGFDAIEIHPRFVGDTAVYQRF